MSWYLEDGKDSDVVVSSRVRIARNIAGKKFVSTASDEELKDILMTIKNSNIDSDLHFINLSNLDELMKNSLVEKRVISRDLLEMKETGILLNDTEDISIMINEEDHLRIQVMKPGFNTFEFISNYSQKFTLDANELSKKITKLQSIKNIIYLLLYQHFLQRFLLFYH